MCFENAIMTSVAVSRYDTISVILPRVTLCFHLGSSNSVNLILGFTSHKCNTGTVVISITASLGFSSFLFGKENEGLSK